MKISKKAALVTAIVTALCFAGCSQAKPTEKTESQKTEETMPNESDNRILIAWFSRAEQMPDDADAYSSATPASGNTETAADVIARLTGGELYEIRTSEKYPVDHSENSQIAHEEQEEDARPPLIDPIDISGYDTIFIGYPIWWYEEPMVIRSFLESQDFSGKTILPFCTSGEVPIEKSVEDIRQLAPDADVKDGLRMQSGDAGEDEDEIRSWLEHSDIEIVR